jgi:hypothetical protein
MSSLASSPVASRQNGHKPYSFPSPPSLSCSTSVDLPPFVIALRRHQFSQCPARCDAVRPRAPRPRPRLRAPTLAAHAPHTGHAHRTPAVRHVPQAVSATWAPLRPWAVSQQQAVGQFWPTSWLVLFTLFEFF